MKRRAITAFPALPFGVLVRAPLNRLALDPPASLLLLSSGRAAAFQTIRLLGLHAGATVLVPAYHCGVEIEAMRRAGAALEFYPVPRSMAVTAEALAPRLRPGVRALFVIHYWGFPQEGRALAALCRERGVVLIEDCAHALFMPSEPGAPGTHGEAALYSLPKMFPVPDGGLLRLREAARGPLSLRDAPRWVPRKAAARSLLEHARCGPGGLLARLAGGLSALRPAARPGSGTEAAGGGDAGESALARYDRRMSAPARRVWARIAAPEIRSRRRRNYAALLARIVAREGWTVPFARLPEDACPLCLPIGVEDRDGLERHLRRRGIEPFVFGRRLHAALDQRAFPDARHLSTRLLGLPVHQDLDEEDMTAIAACATEWLERAHTARRTHPDETR